MRRNRAAQVQYARQQKLGLGWANHDHHTYRCSRAALHAPHRHLGKARLRLPRALLRRPEAGWGAQVMEHPVTGIVTFNDVDLSPDELLSDFAHDPLPERDRLGTVGLWCALHGDSFLEAGMHHLECQFDFDALEAAARIRGRREDDEAVHRLPLPPPGVHRRRALAGPPRADRPPAEGRADHAGAGGQVPREGAIGSHLENLERNQGFKGFNQTGVSEIIAATDPRKH